MINKILVVIALIVFGAAMYVAGVSSPDSVKQKVDQMFSSNHSEQTLPDSSEKPVSE